jgi:hypothetical protein
MIQPLNNSKRSAGLDSARVETPGEQIRPIPLNEVLGREDQEKLRTILASSNGRYRIIVEDLLRLAGSEKRITRNAATFHRYEHVERHYRDPEFTRGTGVKAVNYNRFLMHIFAEIPVEKRRELLSRYTDGPAATLKL